MKKLIVSLLLILTIAKAIGQYDDIFKMSQLDQVYVVDSLFVHYFLSLNSNAQAVEVKKLYEAAAKYDSDFGTMNIKREEIAYALKRNSKLIINEKEAEELLRKIEEHNYTLLEAHANLNLGYYYCGLEKPKLAKGFTHLLKANELFKVSPVDSRFQSLQVLQYNIAFYYYHFRDIENALLMALESFNIKPDINQTKVFTADLIGECYLYQNRFDSALYYFQFVLGNVKVCNNVIAWTGIARGNMGSVYFRQQEYDKAIPLLKEGMQLTAQERIYDNTAGFAADLCAYSITINKPDDAKIYLDTALNAAHIANDLAKYYKVYRVAANYYRAVGKSYEALLYSDSASVMKDGIDNIYNETVKSKAELAFMKQQQDTYAIEKEKQLLTRNFIICGIFMAMIIVLLIFNRQRIKMRNREQQFIAEKQIADQKLNLAQKQLEDFTTSIIEKNKLIDMASDEFEKVNAELNHLRNSKTEVVLTNEETNDSLRMLRNSVILTNSDWNNFTTLFIKVHPHFFENLKNKYPELSPAETRFVTLTKLKLSNKEMASMLGVTTDAIRQIRSRLRKKINPDSDLGFEELVERV